jgi:predicted PurR-regulated permease PerM
VNHTDGGFYPRVFALVTALILGYALVIMVLPFAAPIFWAFLLAFMLYPLNTALSRKLRGRRGLAALLLTLAGVVLIMVPGALIAVAFVSQAGDMVARIQIVADRHHVAQLSDLLRIPIADRLISQLAEYVPITTDQVETWLVDNGRSLLRILMGVSGAALASVLGAVIGLALMLFLLFFFLRDGEELVQRAMRLVPMEPGRKAALLDHLSSVTRALVLGMLLTAAAQGALLGIGVAIVGLFSPVVFGVLTALSSAVPLVGTALVWLPAVLILFAQGRTWAAIFLTVWSLVLVTSIDNVIKPLVVSGRAGLPTFAVFLGLAGGLAAFGAIGMFLGPVIVALAIALLRFAEESGVAKPTSP